MASNSILKLQVDDKQYEASLKSAQQGLQALMNALRNSGKSFSDLDKNTAQYVRALGNMDATAKTTRGRISEMSSAFVELSQVEKQLTDQERQSPVGKALTESLNQLKQRTIEAKQELADLDKQLTSQKAPATTGGIFSGLGSKMEGALAVFGGNLMTKAAGAVAQLGSEMADMVKQGVEMAKAGEGVRIAFERLGNGQILDGLREATHGTVTDLELMKAAVKFNDFKLPLDELGTMLAFAQQKAKDTGQSVDYMVDSIVTGLGRKSLMILDNLGLSAAEIRERMKETGDMTKAVGAIIRDQMKNAGDYVETAADRAAQANVSLQNKMEELGRKFAPVEEASNQLWTSMKIGILDIIGGPLARLMNQLTEAGRLKNMLNNLNGGGNGKETQTEKALRMLREYSGGGRGTEGKRDLYNRQVASYSKQEEKAWREANRLREELKGLRSQQKENGLAGNIQPLISEATRQLEAAENRAKAIQIMRANYQKGAEDIFNPKPAPTTPVVPPTKPTKPTNTDKNLDDEQKVQQKINDLLKEALTADAERQGEIRQQVAELQKQQEKYKDIKNLAQGILPKDKEAVFTIDGQLTEETKKNLREIENVTIDDKTMTVTADTQEAMQKVQDLIGQVSTTTLQMKVAPPDLDKLFPDMSKENYNTGYAGSAQAKYDSARADLAVGPMNFDAINDYIGSIKGMLKDADLGSELYNNMTEKLKDATTVSTLLQEAMTSGVSAVDLSSVAQEMKRKLLEGDIDEDAWQQFLEQINEKIENSDLKLKIDVNTGDVSQQSKEMAKNWQAAGSAIQAVGNAMQQIEDPAAKVMGTIAQAVATMALSYSQAAASPAVTGTGWGWIAFAATGVATMLSSIAAIKQATAGFSNGGVIPGNSMSGDNLRGITPDGTVYGLNSQEIILNRAQQGNLASQLEGGGIENLQLDTVISGESIQLVLNNRGRRTGRGEYVQSKRMR